MTVKWTRKRPGLYVNNRRAMILRVPANPKPKWVASWHSIMGKETRDVATLAEAKRVVSKGY